MATRFQSTQSRRFWSGIIFAIISDFLIVATIIRLFFVEHLSDTFFPSTLTILVIYALQLLYSAVGAARYWVLFSLFERDERVNALVELMHQNKFPKPDEYYADPADYLEEVADSDETTGRAKYLAGAISGALSTFSVANRPVMKIAAYVALEKALDRYSRELRSH